MNDDWYIVTYKDGNVPYFEDDNGVQVYRVDNFMISPNNFIDWIMQLNFNRVITGSDINPIAKKSNIFNDYKEFKATCYTQMNDIYKYIKCSGINRLFKL